MRRDRVIEYILMLLGFLLLLAACGGSTEPTTPAPEWQFVNRRVSYLEFKLPDGADVVCVWAGSDTTCWERPPR